jgi:hypothetical protein
MKSQAFVRLHQGRVPDDVGEHDRDEPTIEPLAHGSSLGQEPCIGIVMTLSRSAQETARLEVAHGRGFRALAAKPSKNGQDDVVAALPRKNRRRDGPRRRKRLTACALPAWTARALRTVLRARCSAAVNVAPPARAAHELLLSQPTLVLREPSQRGSVPRGPVVLAILGGHDKTLPACPAQRSPRRSNLG